MTDEVQEHLWVQGLRLVPNAWIFPHRDALDDYREGNQDYFRSNVPPGVWVGIDEHTILFGRGEDWGVFGRGTVVIGWGGRERVYRAGQHVLFRGAASP